MTSVLSGCSAPPLAGQAPPPQPPRARRSLASRLLRGPRLRPLRRHLPAALLAAAAVSRRPQLRRALAAVALAGTVRAYVAGRRAGRREMDEHERRMRRLRRDVLQHFYLTCIGSMEAEIEEYPLYDQRKHELRYAVVSRVAAEHTRQGATVVDVGCASALVLDRLHRDRRTRGIGFDLSPNGVRQRLERPDAPLLAQAMVEAVPLRDAIAETVIFSEVIEHLVDPWDGLREVSRITKPGGVLVLTTNNASEMPVVSPLVDPMHWIERLLGRWWPRVLAFRNLTWYAPINDPADPLPPETPTYAPHYHYAYAELRDQAADAGFDVLRSGSFEFPVPQSPFAERLRRLATRNARLGNAAADAFEAVVAMLPGARLMGTHHFIVLRKVREASTAPRRVFAPSLLPESR